MSPGATLQECAQCPLMVVIPAGQFRMGSPETEPGRAADEGPVREVHIKHSFAMARFEITVSQYMMFVGASAHPIGGNCITDRRSRSNWQPDATTNLLDPGFEQSGDHPVVCVSWHDAQAYVAWLASETGGPYRLPTEAEWEYAARAGTHTAYFWGDNVDVGCDYMNGTDETARDHYPGVEFMRCRDGALNTARVGSYRSNAFGLHDLTGNVNEWTVNCATSDYSGLQADGADRLGDCAKNIVRGGSWGTVPRQQRSAERIRYAPLTLDDSIGIRIVRELPRRTTTAGLDSPASSIAEEGAL